MQGAGDRAPEPKLLQRNLNFTAFHTMGVAFSTKNDIIVQTKVLKRALNTN